MSRLGGFSAGGGAAAGFGPPPPFSALRRPPSLAPPPCPADSRGRSVAGPALRAVGRGVSICKGCARPRIDVCIYNHALGLSSCKPSGVPFVYLLPLSNTAVHFPLPAVQKPIQKYMWRGFCGHAGCGPPCPARPLPRPRSVSCPAAPRGGCPACGRAVASLRPAGGGPLRPSSPCPAACVRVSRPLPPPARGWGAAIRPAPPVLPEAIRRMLPQSCSNGLHLSISDTF